MKHNLFFTASFLLVSCYCRSQNVGIGTKSPTEKLNVDSGNIRIGGVNTTWQNTATSRFLKIGDNDYITIGEEEGDDKLTIRAKEILLRPSTTYTTLPLSIQGTNNYSHFFFGSNEDTYIRAGKNNANVIINDIVGGKVGIGMSNPTRAQLEQQGSVSSTAAIFGGGGTGISLQQNWPAIGFNSYLDGGGHKSIAQGYGAQLGLNQLNGSLYLISFPFNGSANTSFSSFTQRFYISRLGRIGIGTDDPLGDLHIIQTYPPQAGGAIDPSAGIRLSHSLWPGYWNITSENILEFSYNGVNVAFINSGGQYVQVSDRLKKKNISYVENNTMLTKILQLQPAIYNMISDANNLPRELGFISQDVEKIFPQLICENRGVKMMNYTGLIPVLTKGMQEQQQQIEELKKEIEDLKKLILSKN